MQMMRSDHYRKPSEAQGGPLDRRLSPYRDAGVYVTWKCNLHCPYCGVKDRRASDPTYEMTRSQFERIVVRLQSLNWPLRRLTFSGGEPSLWEPLPWAIDLVHRVADRVVVLTNGIQAQPEQFAGADEIWIANYGETNWHDLCRLRKELRRKMKVRVMNSQQIPLQYVQGGPIPARCYLRGLYFIGGYVYPCQMGDVHTSIEDDFLERFAGIDPRAQARCSSCLGNSAIKARHGAPTAIEIGLRNSNFDWWLSLGSSLRWLKPMLARLRGHR